MANNEAGKASIKPSEFFFKVTGTLFVLFIAIALIRWVIPEPGDAWGIYPALWILIFICAGAGMIFVIWEN